MITYRQQSTKRPGAHNTLRFQVIAKVLDEAFISCAQSSRDLIEKPLHALTEVEHLGNVPEYETNILLDGAGDGRPTLQVGMKSWAKIFGGDGVRRRVTLYYSDHETNPDCVEGISLEIVLWWPPGCGKNWVSSQPKIKQWTKALQKAGFQIYAYGRGWKEIEEDLTSYAFIDAPKYISGSAPPGKGFDLMRQEMEKMNADDLVEKVYGMVLKYCRVVSQLK